MIIKFYIVITGLLYSIYQNVMRHRPVLVDVGQVVPSQSGKVFSRLVHHKVAGDEVEAPVAQLPGVVQLGEEEEGWGRGGGGGNE